MLAEYKVVYVSDLGVCFERNLEPDWTDPNTYHTPVGTLNELASAGWRFKAVLALGGENHPLMLMERTQPSPYDS